MPSDHTQMKPFSLLPLRTENAKRPFPSLVPGSFLAMRRTSFWFATADSVQHHGVGVYR
jgi:hypothetical protein